MSPVVHRSKVDGWLLSVFRISTVAVVLSLASVVPVLRHGWDLLATALVLLVAGILPWWLLRATNYTIDDSSLRIRSGPFRWTVPLAEIRSVTPTTSPLSSPALSLDRLRIEYGTSRWIMVSPEDRERFVADLAARGARTGDG